MKRRNFLLGLISLPFVGKWSSSVGSGQTISLPKLTVGINQQTDIPASNLLDLSLLLACIAEVESGNNDSLIGKHGERSRYQITKEVFYSWCPADNSDFEYCCHGRVAKFVAERYLNWLNLVIPHKSALENYMREYSLAWCWNSGLWSWTKPGSIKYTDTISINNYATRVSNLYNERRNRPQ